MNKDKLKTETHYHATVKVADDFESIDIIQESYERYAIKVKLYDERWRSPEEYIELLKKVIIVIEQNFI